MSTDCPIAIIGMSCRFPGEAASTLGYWQLLRDGKDAYSPSTHRYNAEAFYHINAKNRQNVLPTKGGYFLKDDPYAFDAAFFNITAEEAAAMDPKQRLALEVTYEALENSGKLKATFSGTQTACYIGSSMSDYRDAIVRDFGNSPKYHILGTCEEMIANRISHFLDIHGPSATIQTACSSSLVAIHFGCQSLRSGESDMAIVGGVGVITSPDGTMHLNNLGFIDGQGHSRAFDEEAGGYGRGEGCGILILKRLDEAITGGESIRAVIRASGTNSDGWTKGVTTPSSQAQAALIKHIYQSNNLDFSSTQYIEAHGTGTKVGDPIELAAIHDTIGQHRSKSQKLWVGSVKPNIGHLEAASGVASVIKGVLAMEHGYIPPTIKFKKANANIPLEEWNMEIPTRLMPWPATPSNRRMGINGFGMGGTNAHIVLESHMTAPPAPSLNNGLSLLTCQRTGHSRKRMFALSSQDRAGFERLSHSLLRHLDACGHFAATSDFLANLSYTLAVSRCGLAWRTKLFADSLPELRRCLVEEVGQNAVRTIESNQPRIAFVFTGQGSQWAGMGLELLDHKAFRDSINTSNIILKSLGCEWDILTELGREKEASRLAIPSISQPICTALQIALVEELKIWRITPSKVVGHSSGEIAAAYTVGALTHRDALAIAYFRGQASNKLNHKNGGMMTVGTSRAQAESILLEERVEPSSVNVACVNSPLSVTLSGDGAVLEAIEPVFRRKGIPVSRLKVEVAYHSSHMETVMADYLTEIYAVRALDVNDKRTVMVSSVTATQIDTEMLGPYYWVRNLISPVLFDDALKELIAPEEHYNQCSVDILVEIGPHHTLRSPAGQILACHNLPSIPYYSVLRRGVSAHDTGLELAGRLFWQGLSFDAHRANGDTDCCFLTDVPTYPWNHSKSFHAITRIQRELVAANFPRRSLIGAPVPKTADSHHQWRGFVKLAEEPWLHEHKIGNTVIFPGAGVISIALEAAQQLLDPGKAAESFKLRDIEFSTAVILSEDRATELITNFRSHKIATTGQTPACWWEWTISSCLESEELRDNASGLMMIEYTNNQTDYMTQENLLILEKKVAEYRTVLQECTDICPKAEFYQHMAKASWNYAEVFQGVENCHLGSGVTAFDIKILDNVTPGEPSHLMNRATKSCAHVFFCNYLCTTFISAHYGCINRSPAISCYCRHQFRSIQVCASSCACF